MASATSLAKHIRYVPVGTRGFAVGVNHLARCAILARAGSHGYDELTRFSFESVGHLAALGAAFSTASTLDDTEGHIEALDAETRAAEREAARAEAESKPGAPEAT